MAHKEGWIEAYSLLMEGHRIPTDLKGTVLNNRNGIGETMLHWYSIEGDAFMVEKIIDLGFDVNTQNDFGATPLYECARLERWDIVELLLSRGANPQIEDENGDTVWDYLKFMELHDSIQKLEDLTSR